ncbi:MAG: hypothetical protein OWS74_00965 [Firmicutes bacterium]|nr:hypothetical protein [Bacillota bacterium]
MRKPITFALLGIFLVMQIYWAKVPASSQIPETSWMQVSHQPTTLVQQDHRYYLFNHSTAYVVKASGVRVEVKNVPLTWQEVPQPSGYGIWQLARISSQHALWGGPFVFPAPSSQDVLWLDPRSHHVYFSQGATQAPRPFAAPITQVSQIVWAQDGQAAAVFGKGPQGMGVYLWNRDNRLTPVMLTPQPKEIASFGISSKQSVLAALANGHALWQNHGEVSLPALSPLYVAHQHAALLGLTAENVVFWHAGQKKVYDRPNLKWIGAPKFSANGQTAAILSQSSLGTWHLLIYGAKHQLNVQLPYPLHQKYRLAGFVGTHWILVSDHTAAHAGTYAWWIPND